MITCIHCENGLCPECQADYDYDPQSYWEFGSHPEGIQRWKELQEEMAAFYAANPPRVLTPEEAEEVNKIPF